MKPRLLCPLLAGLTSLLLPGCTGLPKGVKPLANFDLDAYLGTWYEVARLDHPFERGLQMVSAEYSRRADGGVKVVNRGYSPEKGRWKEIEGKAFPVGPPDHAHLKVSFFGPFYSTYCVFELGPDGDYAFVSGASHDYLWLLARAPAVSPKVWARFETRATELGFDLSKLVRVEHQG